MRNQVKFAQHGGTSRSIAISGYVLYRFVLALVLALGSFVCGPFVQFGALQARAAVLNTGYSPSSMNSSNLPQSRVIFYDKQFVKNLKANTPGIRCCNRRELPEQSGNQHQLFMYNALTANTTQVGEGVVGSGITVSVSNTTATIGQYADYVNVSDYSLATAIDPALSNIQKELAYRLGLTLTKLVTNNLDGGSAIDGTVAISLTVGQRFGRANIINAVAALTGRNVKPFDRGLMTGMIHPFIVGDAINDTTNNSLTDIAKRTAEGQAQLRELPSPDGDEVPILEWGGVAFHQTTAVTQTANYLASGSTAFRTYIIGDEAVIAISLGKKEGTQVGDGDWRNLKLWMYRATEPTSADPSRVIGGWTSYNVKEVITLPPDTTMRYRYIDALSNVS